MFNAYKLCSIAELCLRARQAARPGRARQRSDDAAALWGQPSASPTGWAVPVPAHNRHRGGRAVRGAHALEVGSSGSNPPFLLPGRWCGWSRVLCGGRGFSAPWPGLCEDLAGVSLGKEARPQVARVKEGPHGSCALQTECTQMCSGLAGLSTGVSVCRHTVRQRKPSPALVWPLCTVTLNSDY